MAKLARITIAGIRSFGTKEEDIQHIKFSSPVTLILGENGCGKTTIIEALRYACTGENPDGSDRGARFIQEPRLSASSTTKGFVKLELIDSRGNPIIINRGAKVETQGDGKLKYSKLDASLNTRRSDGTEISLSGRCADIGEQVYLIMGVPKPIITNVLFCQQENSLWPLEEDSKVMNRFDEIFEATKYNKCVTEFRKYIKDEKKSLGDKKKLLDEKEKKKNLVERRRAALLKDEESLDEIMRNISKKEGEIEPIVNEIEEICKLETVIGNLQAKCTAKETEKMSLINSNKELLNKIKEEYLGNDYDLEEAINRFEEKKNNNIKNMKNMEAEITKMNEQYEKIDADLQKAQVRIGQLEAEKRQQQEKIKERNKEIDTVAKQLKLFTKIETEDEIKETITSMQDGLRKLHENVNEEREKSQQEEKLQQQVIDTCRENIAKLEQERNSNKTQRTEIQNQQRDTNSQLKQLDISDELLKTMNNKIDQLNRQIKFLLESYDPDELENKIKNTRSEIEDLEKKLESLEGDNSIFQKNYVTEENIATRTRDMIEKESKLFEIKNAQYQNFKLLFQNPPDTDYQDSVERRMREINSELDDLKQTVDTEKQKIFSNQATIRADEQKLESYERKVDECNTKVTEIASNDSFEQVFLDLEKSIEKLQRDRGQYRSAKVIYEKFVKDFLSPKPCCPVCETSFENKESVARTIAAKLKNNVDGIPQALEQVEKELKEKQDTYSKLQQLKPLYEETKQLENNDIPNLKLDINKSKELLHSAEENLKQLNNKMKNQKQLLDIASKVISEATLIDKYNSEIHLYKQEINDWKMKLLPVNSDKSREEVARTLMVYKGDISEKRKSCDSDTKKLNANRKEYHELKEQKSEVERKNFNLEKSMHNKPQLVDQLHSLEEKEKHLNTEIKRIERELIPLSEELSNASKKLNSLKKDNELKYKNNIQDYNKIKSGLDSITKIQIAVETIANKNIDDQIKIVLQNYQRYKTEEEVMNNKKKELSEKIVLIKEEQAKSEINKRNLEDNVEIRKKRKNIEMLDRSIEKLQNEIGTYNTPSALAKRKMNLENERITLITDISNIKGQKDILEKNVAEYKKELQLPENKNAYNIYKRAFYELETKKRAIDDGAKYIAGLEEAIVQFHKEKMNKINQTIKELWRSVYRGNDIDYIQIKTEQPKTKEPKGKRSYNYRVVQIKNGVEVDMRGRCSAGQKVLACLLIRMALAMTFSHSCGILALDEPTTNLDKQNVNSLCETLGTMIQNRSIEKNFQLLIITHDVDFIRNLSQLENIDHCLKVTRNRDGNTVVETDYFH